MEIEGTCVSKNLDEAVRLQSEKRQEWIREIRQEKLQEITEGMSRPRRSPGETSLGTHCSLIVHQKRKDSSCQGD